MFLVDVNGNQIRVVQKEPITSGSVNAYLVAFNFSEEWVDLDRVAVFKTTGDVFEVGLDETNQCFIPWELMTDPDVRIQFGVYGSRGAEIVLPTIWAATDSILQGVITGVEGSEPTETLTGQLIKKIDDLDSRVDAIENGESGPGSPGKDGEDGFSPTVEVQPIDGGHEVTITDVNGPKSFDIMNGHDGEDGANGATFTPSVSEDGVLSWTNDKGLPNPEPVDVKGTKGDPGDTPHIGSNGNWWIGEIDTGVTATGSSIEGDIPVIPKTSTEYDALTDEEKQAEIAYLITDDNEESAGSGSGSSEDIYSTDETRIGRWINGKPLYRKFLIFDINLTTAGGTKLVDIPSTIDEITSRSIRAQYFINNGKKISLQLPYIVNVGTLYYLQEYVVLSDHKMYVNFLFPENNLATITALLEYTKTTDEPEVS